MRCVTLIVCVLYKPHVFDEINYYYSTCKSLLLLCLSWEKVEFRTHKSLPWSLAREGITNNLDKYDDLVMALVVILP